MAFMRAEVGDYKELFLISDELEEALFCKYNAIGLPLGEYDIDDEAPEEDDGKFDDWLEATRIFDNFGIERSFEIVEKFWGVMSAAGYMDRSDYILGDTQAEVAEQMLSMFFDGEVEDMDDDELDDVSMLMEMIEAEEME